MNRAERRKLQFNPPPPPPEKFTTWLVSNDGSYSFFIASEVQKAFKGYFADSAQRELNWISGCQVALFYRDIPKDWKTDKAWHNEENQIDIYNEKGYIE